jgi:hypothetical protein
MYRPTLAILLAFGSPATNPLHGIEYSAPIDDYIKQKVGRASFHRRLPRSLDFAIATLEIILAFGAVALTMETSWELGFKTVSSIYCKDWFGPLLWALLAIVICAAAMFSLSTRVSTRPQDPRAKKRLLLGWLRNQFTTCGNREPCYLSWQNETYTFIIVAWGCSILSVAHLIYGTFWFSTLSFISAGDAVQITGRYMAAAVVCRAIVAYELSGLRQITIVEDHRTINERKSEETQELLAGPKAVQ